MVCTKGARRVTQHARASMYEHAQSGCVKSRVVVVLCVPHGGSCVVRGSVHSFPVWCVCSLSGCAVRGAGLVIDGSSRRGRHRRGVFLYGRRCGTAQKNTTTLVCVIVSTVYDQVDSHQSTRSHAETLS